MLDVIIAGAGPAGSIAALVLARAGARVLVVDRETFPRDKLCGDTLNPGALALLRSMGLGGGPIDAGCPLAGMVLTGPRAQVRTVYGAGIHGRSVTRRVFDAWLLEQAVTAGARFESGLVARGPLTADLRGGRLVRGLWLASRHDRTRVSRIPAVMTIAADGSRSTVARAAGLISHPARPRRWAFGAYATGITGIGDVGEMHIRCGHYLGIAPITESVANVCVVTGPRPRGPSPLDVIRRAVDGDPALAARFARAEFISKVSVLGPLAVEARAPGVAGLLLAGDAAGFVDPMTGDGLHLAMRGAVLAAEEALRATETGDFGGAVVRLGAARRQTLGPKLRFNRALRLVSGSATAIQMATYGAMVAPGVLRRVVRYAGDAA